MYYQTRLRADKPYPVADDFFRPPQLSSERLQALRAEAKQALDKVLNECNAFQATRGTYLANCPPWKLHAEHNGLSAYKRPHKTKPTTSVAQIFGTVDGNYRDLIKFFKSETREEYFNVQKKLFNHTIDAAVLLTVPQRNDLSPCAYEGIKWVAYEPFSLRFRMDSCHYETSGAGVDANGKPYAFRVVIPTEFDEVPDLFKSKRTVRMSSKSVMVAMPSDRNANSTELFMTAQNDFKSNRVPGSMYKRFLMSLGKIHALVDAHKSGSARSVLSQNEWAAQNQRYECGVCARSFSVLRSKHSCFVCGEVVCRRCLVKESDVVTVKSQAATAATGRRGKAPKTKMCTPCVRLLREDQENALLNTPMLGDEVAQLWEKSPPFQHRMSETPTEASYGEVPGSYISAGSYSRNTNSPSECESQPDWVTTPTNKHKRSRSRFSSSRHSSSSSASESGFSSASEDEPEELAVTLDSHSVIYEEEAEMASNRSVLMTLDTSEMTRVPNGSVAAEYAAAAPTTSFRAASGSVSVSQPDMFMSISSSLQEQESLLRQLQMHTSGGGSRMRRTTLATDASGDMPVASV